jgi:SPP1 family predicted phage head-tail adaptor
MIGPTIGQMRKRIRIEQPVRIGDGIGGGFITWQPVDTVWAALDPITGNEAVQANRISALITHQAWMRYRTGITTDMRLVFGIRRFNIVMAINHQERGRRLRLLLEERL